MGRLAQIAAIVGSARASVREGVHLLKMTVNHGIGETTADAVAPSGYDAPPLPGDYGVLVPVPGMGREVLVGVADVRHAGQSEPGEVRIYSRDSQGEPQAEVRLFGDGRLVAQWPSGGDPQYQLELSPDGTVQLLAPEGVTIKGPLTVEGDLSVSGGASVSGEVSASEVKAGEAGAIKLTTHQHTAPMGPTTATLPK